MFEMRHYNFQRLAVMAGTEVGRGGNFKERRLRSGMSWWIATGP